MAVAGKQVWAAMTGETNKRNQQSTCPSSPPTPQSQANEAPNRFQGKTPMVREVDRRANKSVQATAGGRGGFIRSPQASRA
jgi:hypothetical protein